MIASVDIRVGDVRDRLAEMPDQSVHCVVTSPPYWGLRDYKSDGQIGLEPTLAEFIETLCQVFDEVRRVLRDDGTAWVNLGDSYEGTPPRVAFGDQADNSVVEKDRKKAPGRSGNLAMQPARFALAMQDRGWTLRSRIIWAKGVSFCDGYHGSVMPESVNGWRWEGDQLRRGSWRPTSAYEEVMLFAKSGQRYYCDAEAVRENAEYGYREQPAGTWDRTGKNARSVQGSTYGGDPSAGRNLRNVWTINPQPFPDAHFATFPEALVEPCIKAGTSEKGVCPECGSPWVRVVETPFVGCNSGKREQPHNSGTLARPPMSGAQMAAWRSENPTMHLGWRPSCECGVEEWELERGAWLYESGNHSPRHPGDYPAFDPDDPAPATVLDPFLGSGTTALVARKLGRNAIGIELNPEYADMARKRIGAYAPLFT